MPSILQELPDTSSTFLGFSVSRILPNILPPPLLTVAPSLSLQSSNRCSHNQSTASKKRTKSETFDYIMWQCATFIYIYTYYIWCILNQWVLIHVIARHAIIYIYRYIPFAFRYMGFTPFCPPQVVQDLIYESYICDSLRQDCPALPKLKQMSTQIWSAQHVPLICIDLRVMARFLDMSACPCSPSKRSPLLTVATTPSVE